MRENTPNFELLHGLESTYDQIQKVALGGMAEIYRGRQKNLDRPVAIKRIRPDLRQNADIRERFRREAKSSANMLHQNLAHVYDYIQIHDDAYIIMEYIDGLDLAEVIEKAGALPLDVATIIAIKILNGLSHVHAHGMVHRDLKPDNIRISARGEIKIMDFGIAFDPSEGNLTMPGILIGSPHYLSPEQVTGSRLDNRSDIFAFGITFYEMLTAKRPFYETERESVYARIQKASYIDPMQLRPEIPVFYSQIIQSCLQTDPDKRPTNVNRISATLIEYLARNYSLSFEARVKQFLMQNNLMHGDPNLIDVAEPTSPGAKSGMGASLSRAEKIKKWVSKFLIFTAGLSAGIVTTQHYLRIQKNSDASTENSTTATSVPAQAQQQPQASPPNATTKQPSTTKPSKSGKARNKKRSN